MKLKYYLRGLGTGVLFATIVLFIAYSYRMTDARIKEEALKLGMVYPDTEQTGENNVTSSDKETVSGDNVTQNTTEGSSEDETEDSTEATTDGNTEDPTEDTTQTPDVGGEKTCVINVTDYTVSGDVANQLADAGIIEDAEDFNNYLINNGYAYRIQNGQFTFVSGMTYNEMAEMLVGRR